MQAVKVSAPCARPAPALRQRAASVNALGGRPGRFGAARPSVAKPFTAPHKFHQFSKTDVPKERESVVANSSSETPAPKTEPPFTWGANMPMLLASFAVGIITWFLPHPVGITDQAWHMLAIFLGTIVGIVTKPMPLGAVALMGLGVALLTKTMTFAAAFSAFSSEIPWLIGVAFWLSQAFIKSGLGNRIAYAIVAAFGKTTLGLTYSLVAAEALLAPAIPSLAARAGGIFFPLAKGLCVSCGSDPDDGTEKKLGAYIMKVCFQCTCISSAMFITAMAANPLAVNLAAQATGHTITWGQWALGGIVPGIICLLGIPLILYVLYPPEVKDTPDAPAVAKRELAALGPMSRDEKITAASLGATVVMWVAGSSVGINAVGAAIAGLSVLLITNVINWKQCLNMNEAWDTLTWFAALIGMASYLNKYGLIAWFSEQVTQVVASMGLSWQAAYLAIMLLYFYSHYVFASSTAHIGAMFTAMLSVCVASGAPSMLSALSLCYLSNIMGCLTNYGIGSAPSYFGSRYVAQGPWYLYGGILSVFYLVVWLGLGPIWWKAVGLI
ncbi:unnamed protein product [Pedinophyceae sp. YPF-701]|nr:unnamed protein product [Pedinophyceae sp. YPF-701]